MEVTFLFLLLLVGLFVLLLVGGIVLLAVRRRPPIPAPMPAAPVPVSPEDRQAILKKLADGELTKAEAEEQLNQLGIPVPVAMPAPPPRSGASKGCLIALIAALVLPLILLVGAFALFGARVRTSQEDFQQRHIEQVEWMQRQHFDHSTEPRRNQ
ncbi:MAG: hypothetical protein KAU94_10860 [Verrucomicrobia bacterium]|nr:hypothetical protein [Verrucomicrobiota bacterium]